MPSHNTTPPPSGLAHEMDQQKRTRHWSFSEKQLAFIQSEAMYTFFAGGVGSGKTFAGAAKAVITALSDEYAGSVGVIVAPTYPMLEDATLRVFLELMPEAAIAPGGYKKNPYSMKLINGSEILFRSLDKPDALRGTSIAWFWDDEAPYGGYYAWTVMKARLRQNRRDGTPYRVKAWATGTPKGMDKFYEDFEHPLKRKPDHLLIRSASWENRYLREGYVESLGYEGAFYKQDIEGEFTSFEGLVYPMFDSTPTLGHVRSVPRNHQFTRVVGGIDWGYNHPCAVIPFGIDANDVMWQLDEYVESRRSLHEHIIPKVLEYTRRHKVSLWWCDSALPGQIVEVNRALDEARVDCVARPAVKGPDSVLEGIQSVQHQLARRNGGGYGLYIAPHCTKTLGEYGQYQYDVLPEGSHRRPSGEEKPIKVHDDAMDATRYVIHMTYGKGRNAAIPTAWASPARAASEATDPIALALRETEGTDAHTILREALERLGLGDAVEQFAAGAGDSDEQREHMLQARRRLTAGILSDPLIQRARTKRPLFGQRTPTAS